ncbi:MAG: V-type ATP synthase subunit E family protein [Thermoplasmata archaeon]
MSLDRLVEEIRSQGQAELDRRKAEAKAEADRIVAERDRRIAEIAQEAERLAAQEAAREKTQRIAAAKLRARQKVYEAKEARLKESLEETRQILAEFRGSPAYRGVLERMARAAADALGPGARLRGRAEDAELLGAVAGAAFDPAPLPILGGLVARSADGRKDLNLSFDELLRLREDRVRGLLA